MIVKGRVYPKIPPLEEGTYPANCVVIADLGTRHDKRFGKGKTEIVFIFEICGETVTVDGEEKPRHLSRIVTKTTGEKSNFHKYVTAWLGRKLSDDEAAGGEKGFDTAEVLGKACLVQVMTAEKEDGRRSYISSVIAPPKGLPVPPPQTERMEFTFDDGPEICAERITKLPQWIQDMIKASPEWAELFTGTEELPEAPASPPSAPVVPGILADDINISEEDIDF